MLRKQGYVSKKRRFKSLNRYYSSLGQTVVTTNGCFDILHVGHVRYLEKTKAFGDFLIVLLNSDKSVKSIKGPSRPVNSELDRAEILSALRCVDYVVLFDEDSPKNLLDEMKPDVYTKGADYTMETLPEADIMKKTEQELNLSNLSMVNQQQILLTK